MLRRRARLLADLRAFLDARGALEVETPLLGRAAATDAHVCSLEVRDRGRHAGYLQFSPEFAMKRLLCADSGPIYQIGRAFRGGESGRWHNPEFTMLEWYRPGLDHHALMDEVEALLLAVSGGSLGPPRRLRFGELFEARFGRQPHDMDNRALARLAAESGVRGAEAMDRGELFDALLGLELQPSLGEAVVLLHAFPPELAALARVGADGLAQRFELYAAGLELANGYHELLDATECRRRMLVESARRRARGLPQVPTDEHLLAAMAHGMPPAAGVALGVDRLLAVLTGADSLAQVLAFPAARA